MRVLALPKPQLSVTVVTAHVKTPGLSPERRVVSAAGNSDEFRDTEPPWALTRHMSVRCVCLCVGWVCAALSVVGLGALLCVCVFACAWVCA